MRHSKSCISFCSRIWASHFRFSATAAATVAFAAAVAAANSSALRRGGSGSKAGIDELSVAGEVLMPVADSLATAVPLGASPQRLFFTRLDAIAGAVTVTAISLAVLALSAAVLVPSKYIVSPIWRRSVSKRN